MLIELFIPVANNDGQPFSADHHEVFLIFLLHLFGGASRLPGRVDGAWMDNGNIYHDEIIVWQVRLASICDGGLVREAVSFALAHYDQEAIFIRYLGLSEIVRE